MIEEVLGLLAVDGEVGLIDDLIAHFVGGFERFIARELSRFYLGQSLGHIGPCIATLAQDFVGKLVSFEDGHFVLRRIVALEPALNGPEALGGFVLGEDRPGRAVELQFEIARYAPQEDEEGNVHDEDERVDYEEPFEHGKKERLSDHVPHDRDYPKKAHEIKVSRHSQ